MSPEVAIFAVVFVIAIALFGWSCYQRFHLLGLGRSENRFSRVARRIWTVLVYPLGQRCAASSRYPFGFNHAVLFWCFLLLLIANTEFLLHGLFPGTIALSRLPDGAYFTLAFIFDIASILALLAVIAALVRRAFFAPPHIGGLSRDAVSILAMVGGLMIAFFGLHASEIAAGMEEAARFMPVSSLIAGLMSGTSGGTLEVTGRVFWWIHAVILLGFLNYLPYSKHMHILTSIPNCYLRSLTKVNTQPREEFKKGNVFGVGSVDRFTWKGLLDSYSCTECGRCSDNCPATATGKALDPRLVIHDIKVNLLENGPKLIEKKKATLPLIGGRGEGSVSEEAIWDCTTCGACVQVCPVFIEQFPKIIEMRRYLVEMEAKFPPELLAFFENMEQRSNPWGIAPADRTKWAADIDVKPFEAGKTEYLFYVGCAGAFDARSRRVTLANARILDAAGVSWGILGKDELCCGDSLRRLGNEFVFDRLAKQNVKMFQEKGVKKIIAQCPHCFSTIKNDYRQYGLDVEVISHTELINDLLRQNRLKLNGKQLSGNVVFHDSCYLGRHNDIYRAPREAVTLVTGKAPAEMQRSYEKSFCCGAGGGRMWMEESTGKRINHERVEEALREKPDKICVCCPYCMTMFEDGLKEKDADANVQVLDVAEIVAESLAESKGEEALAGSHGRFDR